MCNQFNNNIIKYAGGNEGELEKKKMDMSTP
jgi:hypothetical protein